MSRFKNIFDDWDFQLPNEDEIQGALNFGKKLINQSAAHIAEILLEDIKEEFDVVLVDAIGGEPTATLTIDWTDDGNLITVAKFNLIERLESGIKDGYISRLRCPELIGRLRALADELESNENPEPADAEDRI